MALLVNMNNNKLQVRGWAGLGGAGLGWAGLVWAGLVWSTPDNCQGVRGGRVGLSSVLSGVQDHPWSVTSYRAREIIPRLGNEG